MMRWLIGSSVKARRAVLVAAVVVMAFGVVQLRDAEVDVLPEFAPPTVLVKTEALGLSAEEVEQLVTIPMEQDLLAGVAWADEIRSASAPGLSSIEIIFEPGTNLYRARQVVQERISQAAGLPNVSRPPQMLQPTSSTSRTVMVSLSSKKLTPIQVGVLAHWTIRPRLLAVPGVSNVAVWGQRDRQLQVQVDPQKLRERKVTLQQVIRSTGNALWVSPLTFLEASSPGTGGFIDTPNQRLGIQHNLPIIDSDDLSKVVIEDESSGAPLELGDVATVVEDHQPLIGDALVGEAGDQAQMQIVVEKLPGANTTEVTSGVEAALDELRPGLSGLQMSSATFRPATYVHKSVDNLRIRLIVGALLMLLVLALLFFDWRPTLIATVAIVLSVGVGALVLHLFGTTFNTVVLAGLVVAVGAAVHDALSSVDAVGRRRRGEADEDGRERVVTEAASETGRAVLWATVVFALALLPIFLMDGLSGDSFFPPMAGACLVALVASLLVATTVTPALSMFLLSRAAPGREPPVARWLQSGHARVFAPFARNALPAFVIGAILVATSALVVARIDKAMLPPLEDTNVLIRWEAPFGTSLPEMDRITARAASELRTVAGVREVGTHVGQAVLGDQAVGSDSAEMWVTVESSDHGKTLAAIRRVVAGYTGLEHEVTTYSEKRMTEELGRASDEITVRIFGSDLGRLHDQAVAVKGIASKVDGVTSAREASQAAEPTMEVEVDLEKARAAGIKPGDVRRAAATLISGIRVGNIFEEQKVFDVQVWSTPETRQSLSSVQDLLIDTPSGDPVRLGDVAVVRVRPTVPVIHHEGISRYVDVTVDVGGRDVGAVSDDIRAGLDRMDFPLEYHAELLGDYGDEQRAQGRLLTFAIAAAIGIFLLLQAAFGSWRAAIISFVMLPASLAGGAIAAWIDEGPMTLATVAGLLAVLAIALRNDITLIEGFRRLRTAEGVPFGPDLVARGTRAQVVTTVGTALVTALLVAPALVPGVVPGLEVLHPMVIVILGGLVTSTAVNLLVLPTLYLRFGPRQEPEALDLEAELDLAEAERASALVGVSTDPAIHQEGEDR